MESKRKKRKTRKCLDEIRKRSLLKNTGVKTSHENGILTSTHKLITSNRLTLAMFPRAVCSKTIKRNGSKVAPSSAKNVRSYENKCGYNSRCNNSMEYNGSNMFLPKNASESENESSSNSKLSQPGQSVQDRSLNQSIESFSLFSPGNKQIVQDISETTSSNPPSPSSCRYQIYTDMIEDISTFVIKSVPAVLSMDVLKKNRDQLKVKCFQCNKQVFKFDIWKSDCFNNPITLEPTETFVRNPLDYIKLNSTWKHKKRFKFESFANDSPLNSAISSSSVLSSVINSDINVTPEYKFYPHKLHQ